MPGVFSPLPMKMELIEGSKTSAYINQTPGNYPKGNLLYSVHGESLKSRMYAFPCILSKMADLFLPHV